MQGHQKEVLLTNSPCVGWLCKVFWHLPVDVKPERGKASAIKQVEHFNTFHVPTGMNDVKVFPSSFPTTFFQFAEGYEKENQNKTKNPFSFVQLCNRAPPWLRFPKHFSPLPSCLAVMDLCNLNCERCQGSVILDKFIDHRKRKRILYRLLNKEAWQKNSETQPILLLVVDILQQPRN